MRKKGKRGRATRGYSQRCGARAAATPIDPATTAIIVGVVKLDGEAPKAAKIDMSQDPPAKARTRLKT